MTKTLLRPDYVAFLAEVKDRILQARTSAASAVNRDLILLYWDIGLSRQQNPIEFLRRLVAEIPGARTFFS